MLEEIKTFITLLKENKLTLTIVLIISIISGAFYSLTYKPKLLSDHMTNYFYNTTKADIALSINCFCHQ